MFPFGADHDGIFNFADVSGSRRGRLVRIHKFGWEVLSGVLSGELRVKLQIIWQPKALISWGWALQIALIDVMGNIQRIIMKGIVMWR